MASVVAGVGDNARHTRILRNLLGAGAALAGMGVAGPVLAQAQAQAQAAAVPDTAVVRALLATHRIMMETCRDRPDVEGCREYLAGMAAMRPASAAPPVVPAPAPAIATGAVSVAAADNGPVSPGPEAERNNTSPPAVKWALSADTDKKTGTFKLGFDAPFGDGTKGTVASHPATFEVSLSGPIGDTDTFAKVKSLDALWKSVNVGFSYNVLLSDNRRKFAQASHDRTALENAMSNQCRQIVGQARAALESNMGPDQVNAAFSAEPSLDDGGRCTPGTMHALEKIAENWNTGDEAAKQALGKAIARLTKPYFAKLDENPLRWVPEIYLTLGGKYGRQGYDYYDAATLAKGKITRSLYEASAAMTWLPRKNLALTGEYAFQHSYDEGSASGGETDVRCLPGGTPTLTCASGYFGPPTPKNAHRLSGEARWMFQIGETWFGLAPRYFFEAAEGIHGVQVPLYLVGNDSGMLAGGVRYDWTSEKNASVFGVFVSSSFCIFASDPCKGKSK